MKNEGKIVLGIVALILCLAGYIGLSNFLEYKNDKQDKPDAVASQVESDTNEEKESEHIKLNITLNIEDYYITNTGYPHNLYYIDENNVLWGCGNNNCGQLGQGTQDFDFHEEMVKIAENVVHVDFSQEDFMIYLTKDNKLYGVGNAGRGALRQYDTLGLEQYRHGEDYSISTPYLLMENVIYARCGQGDIACMTEDHAVWIWGTINLGSFRASPVKVLENAALITGGWYNHAALLQDGTVWTWGYNYVGNCGVANQAVVAEPTMVAEGVTMVWTERFEYNIDCQDISELGDVYTPGMQNTIIQKSDGTYWICGENVGNEEKNLSDYFETMEGTIICTHEFLPYDWPEDEN